MANSYLHLNDAFPIGIRRNNPGNLAKGKRSFLGQTTRPDTGRGPAFYAFADMSYGMLALIQVVQSYIDNGYDTLNKFAPKYAPAKAGNNVPDWIKKVGSYAGIKSANALLPTDAAGLKKFVMAIVKKEVGLRFVRKGVVATISPADYDAAVELLAQPQVASVRLANPALFADGLTPAAQSPVV